MAILVSFNTRPNSTRRPNAKGNNQPYDDAPQEDNVRLSDLVDNGMCKTCQVAVRYNLMMRHTTVITGDQLTNALRALDVNFILGGQRQEASLHKQPARLIAALAESDEARLRLSLIPLFLEHPEFAVRRASVHTIAKRLKPAARLTLQCYYSAAVWLAQKYQSAARAPLPDYFSKELHLHPTADPEENLRALAKRHKELSGRRVNWLGTYQHAAQVWQKGLEYKKG